MLPPFILFNAGIIKKWKLKSSGAQVDRDKSELCYVCKLGHCDPFKHKLPLALKLGYPYLFLT